MLPEDLAVEGTGSRLDDVLDLYGALSRAVGAEIRGCHGDLLHGLQPGRDEGEEARAAALEPLCVVRDAVERDIDRASWQAVKSAVARVDPLLGAGLQQSEGQGIASSQWQVLQILLI